MAAARINHLGLADLISQAFGSQPVVNSPACVVDLAGLAALGPPGISMGNISVKVAEGVGEALGQKIGKALAFLVCKARRLAVGGWVGQVNFLVGHIVVTCGKNGLLRVQFCQIEGVFFIPTLAVF